MSRKDLSRPSLIRINHKTKWSSHADRVKAHVKISENGCWNWQGLLGNDGYGKTQVSGRTMRAHRYSYEAFVGPIQDELLVLHKCDNPACVNPDHLYLGDQMQNEKDKRDRGRSPAKEKNVKAKLTSKEVEEMRSFHANDNLSGAELARRFSVSKSTACRILKNKLWN